MTKLDKLTPAQIEAGLARLDEWSALSDAIQRTFLFKDFNAAIAFVNTIAAFAEEADHHPDILIRYNKVTLTLSTHDAGGVTDKDFALAEKADAAV